MADISVIIPCYNVSSFIDRCLTSVTVQTMGINALEIICIDDASTDNTWEQLQKWEKRYPENILLIHCDVNSRQGTARNIGLQYASSSWVAFVDADDWLEPDYFEKMYQITRQGDCDLVICKSDRDYSTTLTYFDNRATEKEDRYMVIDTYEKRKLFLYLNSMGSLAWGKLIRKSLLTDNEIYFPENLTYEDNFWGSLLHLYVNKVYMLEEKLYHYFVNQKSTVLQQNADHHVDLLTVQSMLWSEWERRGFLDIYRDELEFHFLFSCFLGFFKVIALRYQTPPYSLYLLLKEIVKERISNYRTNLYIQKGELSEFHNTLMQSMLLPLNKEEFLQLVDYVKTIGI